MLRQPGLACLMSLIASSGDAPSSIREIATRIGALLGNKELCLYLPSPAKQWTAIRETFGISPSEELVEGELVSLVFSQS